MLKILKVPKIIVYFSQKIPFFSSLMATNSISNFAANQAHRHLRKTNVGLSFTLAKLSAGKRVQAAGGAKNPMIVLPDADREIHPHYVRIRLRLRGPTLSGGFAGGDRG